MGRVAANCILLVMTRALDAAIAKLATLPADEQDRIAQWLLDELRDDEHWARQFATSQDALGRLAEAYADFSDLPTAIRWQEASLDLTDNEADRRARRSVLCRYKTGGPSE